MDNMEPETISFDESIPSIGQQSDVPEKKLWAAVLIQAVDDLNLTLTPQEMAQQRIKGTTDKKYLKSNAKAYFKSKRTDIGSFIWICTLFDINPDLARQVILWKPMC